MTVALFWADVWMKPDILRIYSENKTSSWCLFSTLIICVCFLVKISIWKCWPWCDNSIFLCMWFEKGPSFDSADEKFHFFSPLFDDRLCPGHPVTCDQQTRLVCFTSEVTTAPGNGGTAHRPLFQTQHWWDGVWALHERRQTEHAPKSGNPTQRRVREAAKVRHSLSRTCGGVQFERG